LTGSSFNLYFIDLNFSVKETKIKFINKSEQYYI